MPTLTRAAAGAGRPAPRVVAFTQVCVTVEPEARRAAPAGQFTMVDDIPGYRAVLDRGGVAGPADTALLGDEAAVESGLRALADAGATELITSPPGTPPEEQARTREPLAELSG
ncbi:hypothetical protein [Streptomyces iranensis]|uniref:hypothetical protein n=1 Tax=Streptomyces iranensis TaxID=576784 RepID=UPI0039B72358